MTTLTCSSADASDRAAGTWRGWLLIFIAAWTLYAMTASRTIGWQDSGQYVLRVARGELANPFGLALTHPLHFWLCRFCARIFPIELPTLLPLIAAAFGAMAVANVYGIVKTLVHRAMPAILGASSLAVAHTFWHMSTLAKGVDPMATALLTCELWSLIQWDRTRHRKWLIVLFLINGLGFANSNTALLTLPVIGIVLILALKSGDSDWRTFLFALLLWLLASTPFTGYVAHIAWTTGEVRATLESALFGHYTAAVLGHQFEIRFTLTSLAFTFLSFPNLTLPAALLGIARGPRVGVSRMVYVSLVSALAIQLLFVLRYEILDQYTFLLPAYSVLAILAGFGFAYVQSQFSTRRRRAILTTAAITVAMTPVLYLFVPGLARRANVIGIHARHKPYRDDYQYIFQAWARGETSADCMSREAIDLVGRRGIIIAEDGMGAFAIQYKIDRNKLSDVTILMRPDPGEIMKAIQNRGRVVFVPASVEIPPAPPRIGHWDRVGDLYVLAY